MKKTITITLMMMLSPLLLAETKAPESETTELKENPEKGNKDKATKEKFTGIFKKLKDGRVILITDNEQKLTLVKAKYEQVGEHFNKKISVICKTKTSPNKEGNKLIVQINKIEEVKEQTSK